MKILKALFLFVFVAISSSCFGLVHDHAHMLKASDKKKIEGWIGELEEKTSTQIAVVTVSTMDAIPLEEYAVNLFKSLGIGQKAKDNGILLLVAEKQRQLRIEVGYGLEGILTDAIAHKIINRDIVPEFKNGHYSKGIAKGVWEITSLVAREANVVISNSTQLETPDFIGFLFVILMFIIVQGLRRKKGGGSRFVRNYNPNTGPNFEHRHDQVSRYDRNEQGGVSRGGGYGGGRSGGGACAAGSAGRGLEKRGHRGALRPHRRDSAGRHG